MVSPELNARTVSSSSALTGLFTWKRLVLVLGLLVMGAGYWAWEVVLHHATESEGTHSSTEPADPPSRTEVQLSPEKLAAVKVQTIATQSRELQSFASVPGRIEYDARHLLELRAPVAGLVKQLHVQSGDRVRQGDPLIVIDGPEIGNARAEIQKQRGEESLREREYQRACDIEANVRQLRQALERGDDSATIEKQFHDKHLGEYREKLIATYSQLTLARKLIQNIKGLSTDGVTSQRVLQERQSALEVAQSVHESAMEQALFGVEQSKKRLESEWKYAVDVRKVMERKLASLAGKFSLAMEDWNSGGSLTELTLRAPFSGRIERRDVMEGSRFNILDPMFTLADKEHLWVSIEIRENQWDALQVKKGQRFAISTPAIPGKTFDCCVEFVGGAVGAQSRSVPIVALLENHEALFKPGMLVWVEIPEGAAVKGLAIPSSAVMKHEGKSFVFVPKGERTYVRRDVQVGLATEQWSQVTAGLNDGEPVVTQGAFVLKSELLLEAEE